jgi:hypothetical protein
LGRPKEGRSLQSEQARGLSCEDNGGNDNEIRKFLLRTISVIIIITGATF